MSKKLCAKRRSSAPRSYQPRTAASCAIASLDSFCDFTRSSTRKARKNFSPRPQTSKTVPPFVITGKLGNPQEGHPDHALATLCELCELNPHLGLLRKVARE